MKLQRVKGPGPDLLSVSLTTPLTARSRTPWLDPLVENYNRSNEMPSNEIFQTFLQLESQYFAMDNVEITKALTWIMWLTNITIGVQVSVCKI